jgi:hypothetical protein
MELRRSYADEAVLMMKHELDAFGRNSVVPKTMKVGKDVIQEGYVIEDEFFAEPER